MNMNNSLTRLQTKILARLFQPPGPYCYCVCMYLCRCIDVSAASRGKDPYPLPCSWQVAPRSDPATTSDQTNFKHVTFQPSRPSKTFQRHHCSVSELPTRAPPKHVGNRQNKSNRTQTWLPGWLFVPVVLKTAELQTFCLPRPTGIHGRACHQIWD